MCNISSNKQLNKFGSALVCGLILSSVCFLTSGCAEQDSSSTQTPQKATVKQASSTVSKPVPAKYISGPPPPAWLKKLDPATATAEAKLNKRYTLAERESLFHQLQVRQTSTQAEIHLKFTQMPPTSSGQETMDRYREEGDEEFKSKDEVEASFCRENRLTSEELSQLFQEANDNNWP